MMSAARTTGTKAVAPVILTASFLSLAGVAHAAQTDWETLAPAGEGFSVEMPGAAEQRNGNDDPEHFQSQHDYRVSLDGGHYEVTVFHLHPGKRQELFIEEVVALAQYDSGADCSLEEAEYDNSGPHSVWYALYFCNNDETERVWTRVSDERIYRQTVRGAGGFAGSDDALRFSRSFRILEE